MEEAGVSAIKAEYILPEQERKINLDHVSDKDRALLEETQQSNGEQIHDLDDTEEKDDDSSLATADGETRPKKRRFQQTKKFKGQNKKRGPTFAIDRKEQLCDSLVHLREGETITECPRNACPNSHNIDEFLKNKPADIGPNCYLFETFGKCSRGLACRFGKSHITADGRDVIDQKKYDIYNSKGPYVKNQLDKEVQWALRKRTYNFDLAEKLIHCYDQGARTMRPSMTPDEPSKKTFGAVTDEDIIKLKSQEKKTIPWADKLYLSPLTTVGNLPFRRICKEFGAEITCGEMAMCSSLLQGMPQEWALMKRHHTEDIFGVQLCANNPHLLAKCGQLIEKECDVDFIDLNAGCPIDWVFKRGGGSGLLLRPKILESCVTNLSDILSIPMTIKTRTGAYKDENVAHELALSLKNWGVSLITVHGRSREQRYTKSADWAYIRQVAINAAPVPVFGCGDVLSFDDYARVRKESPEVAGVMIGRGALIKPWIFTEIKQQKLWDISSTERFEILKKYVNYGLEHWGSDSRGVENTRRFILEWLSFLCRYIPVGLLERPPQKMNERPPYYRGRDDLETLFASPSAADWIKISEMLLGKVPEGFKFIPKHKANSYQETGRLNVPVLCCKHN
ncbi:tRNA-dihydrouridine(47) synthase [NAD(P)(+)]-like isoform X2 [Euwallacea fornicatus]|uniref:tRNA-dihydrouridine(47) synthase [NAD(P)(+)]-like isoform X2 n=1 Tax=Euwallacea fornicatus TaxID=995702 RepID=UPI00338EE5FD